MQRLVSASLIAVVTSIWSAPAPVYAAEKFDSACGVLVSKRTFNCNIGSDEKCECLVVASKSTAALQIKYSVQGGVGASSFPLSAGKTSRNDACTSNSRQTIEYGGCIRQQAAKPKPKEPTGEDWCKLHGNFERPDGTKFCAE